MASSAYPEAQSSATRCSCRGEIPHLKTLVDQNEPAVDDILKAASQSIEFWPRLKSCQACLQDRLEELLAAYDKIVSVLHATAGLFRAPGPPSNETPRDLARSSYVETTALRCRSQTGPTTTNSASVSASQVVPPMFLGDLRLDHEQSLASLRIVYHGVFKQLASILYEMRRIETGLDARLDSFIGDLLYTVLNLMEPGATGS
jgi:hypothetical protein